MQERGARGDRCSVLSNPSGRRGIIRDVWLTMPLPPRLERRGLGPCGNTNASFG